MRIKFLILQVILGLGVAASASACDNFLHCYATDKLNGAMSDFVHYADDNGKQIFGDKFSVAGSMGYSSFDNHISGDLDAVIPIPLTFFAFAEAEEQSKQALFFQSGLTRWKDSHNFYRDDFRQGLVYRFAISEEEDSDVAGMWAFIQNNRQRGHARFSLGGDYATTWGAAKFHYSLPLTGWRRGRFGYEEKPLEEGDIIMEFDVFSRLSFDIGAGRREKQDGSEKFDTYGRLGAHWQILPLLSMDGTWRKSNKRNDSLQVNLLLDIPLDGVKRGYTSPRRALPAAANLYRAITTPRRIEVTERKIIHRRLVDGVTVRFMQENTHSGGQIILEVLLPEAVDKDANFVVHLVPGEGDNPAVPGVDFDEKPMPVTIKKGERRGTVKVTLIFNETQTQTRTLDAEVYTNS